jgi:predicted nucleic acid-binding protein
LSKACGCSAYDFEFVALADFPDIKFVTADAKLATAFPNRGVMLF